MATKLMYSPWGPVQNVEIIAEGITCVSTASHGGFKLDRKRQAKMPKALVLKGGWYEEDVEYNRVVLAFPHLFDVKTAEQAHQTLKNFCPEVYESWTGKTLSLEESHKKRIDTARIKHKNDYVVVSAFGDWHKKVPLGMVGVFACKGGRMENGQYSKDCKWFLVTAQEYDLRDDHIGFVIDLQKHQEIQPLKGD